jgi:hypothetical protein
MSNIGTIVIPESDSSLVFPRPLEYPFVSIQAPVIAAHLFNTGDRKISQRFLIGANTRQFTVNFGQLSKTRYQALVEFFTSLQGPYSTFLLDDPNGSGQIRVRLADETFSLQMAMSCVASGASLTLVEVPDTVPSYTISTTSNRFPGSGLNSALLDQAQEIIPLVKIIPQNSACPAIYLSDRKVTVGGFTYEPRLLDWSGIGQSSDGASDQAGFSFGNADRVFTELTKAYNIVKARIEFSLFHVGTTTKLDLWAGEISDWNFDSGNEFKVQASEGIWELRQSYPVRKVSRTCGKTPAGEQGGIITDCPFTGTCDRTFAGCGAKNSFGGILINPETVYQHTGAGALSQVASCGVFGVAGMIGAAVWGGPGKYTAKSITDDNMYGKPLPEVYMDYMQSQKVNADGSLSWDLAELPVDAIVCSVRDENEFVGALGIVSEGKITEWGVGHTLNGARNHGVGTSRPNDGLRLGYGFDPLPTPIGDQFFNLSDTSLTYTDGRAAGTAFIELRTIDEEGRQLNPITSFNMKAYVRLGIEGWYWDAPGARGALKGVMWNPIWIAVNMMLRSKGLQNASAAVQEQYFDVQKACDDAAFCAEVINKVVAGGNTTTRRRYEFRGVVSEDKALKVWISQVLNTCLGGYTFSFGKLRTFLRANSGAVSAFTQGNILADSLQVSPLAPAFNQITTQFGNGELEFVNDSTTIAAHEHARMVGSVISPSYTKSDINLTGVSSRDESAVWSATRLKEELGGATQEEWVAARKLTFKTTILALETEPGMVCSLTHPDVPVNEPTNGTHEFRISSWKLNKDYSIDIEGKSCTDSMYDMLQGPNPADIEVSPLPVASPTSVIPPDVSDVSVPGFIDSDLVNTVRVKFKVPDNPGTLTAVKAYIRMPHDAAKAKDGGRHNIDFTQVDTDGYYEIHVDVTKPTDADSNEIIYLVSCSQVYEKVLNLVNTPHTVQLAIFKADLASSPSAPGLPTSVVGYEVGTRTLEMHPSPQTMGTFRAAVTIAAGNDAQWIDLWLIHAGRQDYKGSFPVTGLVTNIDIPEEVPPTSESWVWHATTGKTGADNPPSSFTASLPFTVNAIAPPGMVGATLIIPSGAGGAFPYDATLPNGHHYWLIPRYTWSDTPRDSSAFFYRVTSEDLGVGGVTVRAEEATGGTMVSPSGVIQTESLMGEYGRAGNGANRTGNIEAVKLRLYLCSTVDQTTDAWKNPLSATLQHTVTITVAVGAAIPVDVLDATTINPATWGYGMYQPSGGAPQINTNDLSNMVLNGTFENGVTGWTVTAGVAVQNVGTGAKTPPNALALPSTGTNAYESKSHPCKGGQKFYVEYWIAVPPGTPGYFQGLIITHRADGTQDNIFIDNTADPGGGQWKKMSTVVTMPDLACEFIFYCGAAAGTAAVNWLLDSVTIRLQTPTGPGTTTTDDGGVQLSTTDLSNIIYNGGFEFGAENWVLGGSAVLVNGPTYAGLHSMQFDTVTLGGIIERARHSCLPGQQYFLEAYVTGTPAATDSIYLQLIVFTADGTQMANLLAATTTAASTGGAFTKISGLVTIPSGSGYAGTGSASTCAAYCASAGGSPVAGHWFIDNIRMVPQTPCGPGTVPDGKGGVKVITGPGVSIDGDGNVVLKVSSTSPIHTDSVGNVTIKLSNTMSADSSGYVGPKLGGKGVTVDADGNLVVKPGGSIDFDSSGNVVVKPGPGLTFNAGGALVPNQGATVGVNASGQLVVPDSSLRNANILSGELGADLSRFSATAQPYGLYYGLPSAAGANVPNVIINTAETPWRIYNKVAGAWVAQKVQPGDLIAGTVTALVSLMSPAISGGSITGSSFSASTSSGSVTIDPTLPSLIAAATSGYRTRIEAGVLYVELTSGSHFPRIEISPYSIAIRNAVGAVVCSMSYDGTGSFSNIYTMTAVDNLLAAKANASNVYTKAEVDSLLTSKASHGAFPVVGGFVTI